MKTRKFKEGSIKICETIDDINIKRFMAMKEWIIYKESGMSMPSLKELYVDTLNAFDSEKPSRIVIGLHDQIRAINFVENGFDPDQMLFALMSVEEGEDVTVTDHTQLKEKCDRLAKLGLSQGEAVQEVANFIKALFGS